MGALRRSPAPVGATSPPSGADAARDDSESIIFGVLLRLGVTSTLCTKQPLSTTKPKATLDTAPDFFARRSRSQSERMTLQCRSKPRKRPVSTSSSVVRTEMRCPMYASMRARPRPAAGMDLAASHVGGSKLRQTATHRSCSKCHRGGTRTPKQRVKSLTRRHSSRRYVGGPD